MAGYGFFALIGRMRHITRWALMRNTEPETIEDHSYQTAVLAHALCTIGVRRYGEKLDPQRACLLALYHDAPEILTGDMPTPVKYRNPSIREAYGEIEKEAVDVLLGMLPDDLQPDYSFLKSGESEPEWVYVKAADTLSAYLKCRSEERNGNREFRIAGESLLAKLEAYSLPALNDFLAEFTEPYDRTLDELK